MALTDFGAVPASSTLPIFFTSHDGATGANEAASNLAVGDILIYKGTSMTQRSSTSGFTLIDTDGLDLDGLTGVNGVAIDLSDNTDSGFYAVGSFYNVVLGPITIDTQTVYLHLATFRIVAAEAIAGKPKVDVDAWLGTAAATPTVNGVPEVDITHIGGTAVTAAAGIPEVKVASIANGAITAASVATDAIDADAIAADAVTEIQSGLATASALSTVAGYVDTEVAAILAAVDTEVAAIKAVTDQLPDGGALTSLATQASVDDLPTNAELATALASADDVTLAAVAALNNVSLSDIEGLLDEALADSVPADGSLPSLRQAMYEVRQFLMERVVAGTTLTTKKVDGSTTLETFTLDSATAPTSITRAT